MPMTNEIAAARITNVLIASEIGIDRALSDSATLLASLAQARLDTEAPFATGQVAIMRLVQALGSLSAARADMMRVHGDLRKVSEERCDLVFPDECPPAQASADSRMRLVV